MTTSGRAKALRDLEGAVRQLDRLEALLDQRDFTGVLDGLIEARRLCQQAVITLLTRCLQDAFAGAQSSDPAQREGCLQDLLRLTALAQSRLCHVCRQRLYAALKET